MKKHLFIADIFIYSFLSVVLFLFVSVIRVNASSYPLTIYDFGTITSYSGSDIVSNFNFIQQDFINSHYIGRLAIGSTNQNITSLYVRLKEVPLPYRYSRFFFIFRSSQIDVIPSNVVVNDTYTYPITCSNYVNQHSQESTIKTFYASCYFDIDFIISDSIYNNTLTSLNILLNTSVPNDQNIVYGLYFNNSYLSWDNEIDTSCHDSNLFNFKDTIVVDDVDIADDGFITVSFDNSGGNVVDFKFYTDILKKLKLNTKYNLIFEIKNVTGNASFYPVTTGFNQSLSQFSKIVSYSFSDLSSNSIYNTTITTLDSFSNSKYMLRSIVRFSPGHSGSITFRISVTEDFSISPNNFVYQPFGKVICKSKSDETNDFLNKNNQLIQEQIDEQKNEFDEFMNGSELDDTSKADQSDFDSYSSNEDSLKSVMSSGADFSNVKVNLDSGTNNFVWDLVTRFVQSNSLVFGLVISVLSIGIIKLVFNR